MNCIIIWQQTPPTSLNIATFYHWIVWSWCHLPARTFSVDFLSLGLSFLLSTSTLGSSDWVSSDCNSFLCWSAVVNCLLRSLVVFLGLMMPSASALSKHVKVQQSTNTVRQSVNFNLCIFIPESRCAVEWKIKDGGDPDLLSQKWKKL